MRKLLIIIYVIAITLSTGCTIGSGAGSFPPLADLEASPPLGIRDDGHDRKMLIGDGLGETLTLVDRTDGVWRVSRDVLPIGQGVSQMLIRNGICYIVNALSNSIQIVDPVKLKTIGEISLGAGTNPEFMDFVDDHTAVVSCYLTNEVVLVDLSPAADPHDRILARIPMPTGNRLPHDPGIPTAARPGGIAALGDQCYVACANLSMMHVAGDRKSVV